jgi:uncharacterized protein YndB with AHSA1/START domain
LHHRRCSSGGPASPGLNPTGRCPVATTTPSAALVAAAPVFTYLHWPDSWPYAAALPTKPLGAGLKRGYWCGNGQGGRMAEVEQSRELEATAEAVWRLVSDPDRLAEWVPTIAASHPAGQGTVQLQGESHGHDYNTSGRFTLDEAARRLSWDSPRHPGYRGVLAVAGHDGRTARRNLTRAQPGHDRLRGSRSCAREPRLPRGSGRALSPAWGPAAILAGAHREGVLSGAAGRGRARSDAGPVHRGRALLPAPGARAHSGWSRLCYLECCLSA